ncbi:sensor histidine kinase [Neptunicella sp. SCSIO 80796]|uniref:sensor histidine kinase n=1 Tax=Neptunicella plasticusilytica TaxID=3117012 RepID=UPI003A4DBBDF
MHNLLTAFKHKDIKALLYCLLPLVAAVLLEAHIRFLSLRLHAVSDYLSIVLQLFIESLPLLLAHYFARTGKVKRQLLIWLAGFVVYPLLIFALSSQLSTSANMLLFSVQGWVFATVASLAWFINRGLKKRHESRVMALISRLFSLDAVVLLLMLGWVFAMAGMFNSHIDPVQNQPLEPIIDIGSIFTEFPRFCGYFWQFLVLGGLLLTVYVINRYFLLRQILAKQGVVAFAMAVVICLIVLTPLLAAIALLLPLNSVVADFTLLPSGNHDLFSKYNYQFMFALLAVSTPLILAFERQQQDAELSNIARQQMRTELKLLQQQINPHFLFNTLNNLYALTLRKSDDAPEMVMQLSNLLRYTVYEGQKEQVTLAQEVAYLQDFIALQQIRLGDKCRLDLRWPDNAEHVGLPPLLLIVLLENAFKYATEHETGQSTIRFHLQLNQQTLHLLCENSLSGQTPNESSGVGLENLQRRLTLIYPDQHDFKSQAVGDDAWRAELRLELTPC